MRSPPTTPASRLWRLTRCEHRGFHPSRSTYMGSSCSTSPQRCLIIQAANKTRCRRDCPIMSRRYPTLLLKSSYMHTKTALASISDPAPTPRLLNAARVEYSAAPPYTAFLGFVQWPCQVACRRAALFNSSNPDDHERHTYARADLCFENWPLAEG